MKNGKSNFTKDGWNDGSKGLVGGESLNDFDCDNNRLAETLKKKLIIRLRNCRLIFFKSKLF